MDQNNGFELTIMSLLRSKRQRNETLKDGEELFIIIKDSDINTISNYRVRGCEIVQLRNHIEIVNALRKAKTVSDLAIKKMMTAGDL